MAPSATPAVPPPRGGPAPHHENLIPNAFAARGREAVGKEAPSWGLDLEMASASWRGAGRTDPKSGFSPKGRGWMQGVESE